MKNIYTIIIILGLSFPISAQENLPEWKQEIRKANKQFLSLKSENLKLSKEIRLINSNLRQTQMQLDSLKQTTRNNIEAIADTANKLEIQIQETSKKSDGQISEVKETVSNKTLLGIIGILTALLVSGLLYWFLYRRQKTDKSDLIEQLSQTKISLEENLIKEFGRQAEMMETQLNLMKTQKLEVTTKIDSEPDHSLPLKLANEINLIERNINLMDAKTRGLKQLQASVGKLKDNLAANGYEIPDMLGRRFDQGMRVIVTTSIPDETLENGQEVISKILIPQVNFNNKMIQTAQIEVSVGY